MFKSVLVWDAQSPIGKMIAVTLEAAYCSAEWNQMMPKLYLSYGLSFTMTQRSLLKHSYDKSNKT